MVVWGMLEGVGEVIRGHETDERRWEGVGEVIRGHETDERRWEGEGEGK
jgi:hypothetical protein